MSIPLLNHELQSIAIKVTKSLHGGFLRTFADAYLKADNSNKRILWSAWTRLIEKYQLDEEYGFLKVMKEAES